MSKAALDLLPAGTRLGKYEIVRLLGAGGMGSVYEGLHVELKKRVAIKTLHPELALKQLARQRFLREGEAASRIRHPHVVDVTDVDTHDGMPFLVMEFLEGLDLKQYILQRGPMAVVQAVDYLVPAVAAVAAGHDEGVIHRDLKPHNIFLAQTRNGEVVPKVLDFGVSKLLDPAAGGTSLTGTAAVMGTIAYMSPEQAKGAKFVDGRTDQYALALILYECLTGRRPHRGENSLAVLRQIGDGDIDPPSLHVPGIPRDLEGAVMKGLAVNPDERYPSLYAFGRALLPFASGRVQAAWQSTFERDPRPAVGTDVFEDSSPSLVGAPVARDVPRAGESGRMGPVLPGTGTTPLGPSTGAGARPPSAQQDPARPPAETTLGQSAAEAVGPSPPRPAGGKLRAAAGVAVAAALGAVAVLAVGQRRDEGPVPVEGARSTAAVVVPAVVPAPVSPRPRTLKVDVEVEPPEASIELDGAPVATGALVREIAIDGQVHVLRVTAPGYAPASYSFSEAPPPGLVRLEKLPVAKPATARRQAVAKPAAPAPGPSPAPTRSEPSRSEPTKIGPNKAPIITE